MINMVKGGCGAWGDLDICHLLGQGAAGVLGESWLSSMP